MGLQHIRDSNLEPEDELRRLVQLRSANHQQIQRINQILFNHNLGRTKRERLQRDKKRKEFAQEAITIRIADLIVQIHGKAEIHKVAEAEGTA